MWAPSTSGPTVALVVAGCSSSSKKASGSTLACVILPDSASSPRWENGDRPAIDKALTEAGFKD